MFLYNKLEHQFEIKESMHACYSWAKQSSYTRTKPARNAKYKRI